MHLNEIIWITSKDLLSLEVQVKAIPTIQQALHFYFGVCDFLRLSNADFFFE